MLISEVAVVKSYRPIPNVMIFYPTALKGCQGIVFTHGCPDGWAGGGEQVCLACISETVSRRKLILGRDIG